MKLWQGMGWFSFYILTQFSFICLCPPEDAVWTFLQYGIGMNFCYGVSKKKKKSKQLKDILFCLKILIIIR